MQCVIAPTDFVNISSTSRMGPRESFQRAGSPYLMRVPAANELLAWPCPSVLPACRRFLGASECAFADHDGIRAAGERLANVAAFVSCAVGEVF